MVGVLIRGGNGWGATWGEVVGVLIAGIEITLARSPLATGLCFGGHKIWNITFLSREWRARNLILSCTLRKCLVCFWLKLSSDFAVMSEENDM